MKIVNKSKLMLAVFFGSALLFSGCSGDDAGDPAENCLEVLQELALDLSNKGQAFSANPTQANCQAVKNAGLALSAKAIDCEYEEFETIAQQYASLDCSAF